MSGMSDQHPDLRAAYLTAAESTVGLLGRGEVADRWSDASACSDWTVGGLAAHLAGQILNVPVVIRYPHGGRDPISLSEHYARAEWVTAGPDDEINVSIRRGSDQVAAAGPHELLRHATEALDDVRGLLGSTAADEPVLIPWQGWALLLGDFLTTRMMEIAVHSDDLAVSIGVEPPPLPGEVLEPVFALLTAVAAQRHGATAVLRSLTRPDRLGHTVSAF